MITSPTYFLQKLPDAVVISDGKTRVLFANEKASQVLKFAPASLKNLTLVERVHPEDRANVKRYARILKQKKQLVTKRRFKRGDGRYAVIERSTTLLPDNTQLSICRDITTKEDTCRRREMFISIAGHELRDPLSLIQTYTNLLSTELGTDLSGEADSLIRRLDEQIVREKRLIDDFLDLSRIKRGKIVFRMDIIDLEDLVERAADHMRQTTGRKIIVSIQRPIDRMVYGDRDRLHQVLVNLLSNAVKFSPPTTAVEVDVACTGMKWKISVHDYGIGIKVKQQSQIFKGFYQVEKKARSGLGLGLYLASEIVKHHRGTLRIQSHHGAGSTFTITLPRIAQHGA